jgi:hypothetical protein
VVGAVLIDQLNLCIADFIVGARPVFGCSGRGSIGTANGDFSKVVNEGDSLKELAVAGKQTHGPARENHQMRGFFVTPAKPTYGQSRHKARALVPQGRDAAVHARHPLTDRARSTKQQGNKADDP